MPESKSSSLETVVVVEPTFLGSSVPRLSAAMSRRQFEQLNEDVEKLKDQVKELAELPANASIIQAIR